MVYMTPDDDSTCFNFYLMKYRHIFFDLDHTLWDFDANAKATLIEVYDSFKLSEKDIPDFEYRQVCYLAELL